MNTAREKTTTVLPIIASFLVLLSSAANADYWFVDRLNPGASGLRACASVATGVSEGGAALSRVARCITDQTLSGVIDGALGLAEDQGQEVFGKHFRIDNRLGLSVDGGGLRGDFDAVIPLQAFSSTDSEADGRRVLFMQSGVTQWTDKHGFRRNDQRHGLVRRFAALDDLGEGIFGLWIFFQQSLERDHERFVTGMDYAGRWGTGSLNYFMPTTGWLPGRPGYEERALEGMELDLRFNATSTITLNAAAGRWEAEDGSGRWTTRSRLGLDWRPHPWLRFGGNWSDSGSGGDTVDVRATVTIPFGGARPERFLWQGFGVVGGGVKHGAADVWRSVDHVGRIEVAERTVPIVNSDPTSEATVRFLQNSVDTGGTVRVEIVLSSPAPTDTPLTVQLVPGGGLNPAVPGEDYVDEAVEVTIGQRTTSATAAFRLLKNPALQTARSLSVTVTAVR